MTGSLRNLHFKQGQRLLSKGLGQHVINQEFFWVIQFQIRLSWSLTWEIHIYFSPNDQTLDMSYEERISQLSSSLFCFLFCFFIQRQMNGSQCYTAAIDEDWSAIIMVRFRIREVNICCSKYSTIFLFVAVLVLIYLLWNTNNPEVRIWLKWDQLKNVHFKKAAIFIHAVLITGHVRLHMNIGLKINLRKIFQHHTIARLFAGF